jgi:hypothetical protein
MIQLSSDAELTVKDAAALLGKTPGTIRKWFRVGYKGVKLNYEQVGREKRTTAEEVQRFKSQVKAVESYRPDPSPAAQSRESNAVRERLRSKHNI